MVKRVFFGLSVALTGCAALLFAVGEFLQSRKAEIGETTAAEGFDSAMNAYYAGQTLVTAALCAGILAAACWLTVLITRFLSKTRDNISE